MQLILAVQRRSNLEELNDIVDTLERLAAEMGAAECASDGLATLADICSKTRKIHLSFIVAGGDAKIPCWWQIKEMLSSERGSTKHGGQEWRRTRSQERKPNPHDEARQWKNERMIHLYGPRQLWVGHPSRGSQ